MATIKEQFDQAQVSMAAYALNLDSEMPRAVYQRALVAKGMSVEQARVFADTYTVVHQFTDALNGFSATVFDRAGTKYFAIRGTEGFSFAGAADWLTNVDGIGEEGIAVSWYARERHERSD